MAKKTQTLTFKAADKSKAVAVLKVLIEAEHGWVNFTPADFEAPKPTSVWGRINGRGPQVPRLTFTAPRRKGNNIVPAQLGLEHPAGIKALNHLATANHPLPPGWQRLQDHPMRGLVVVPSPESPPEETLIWGLRAAEILARLDHQTSWRGEVWR